MPNYVYQCDNCEYKEERFGNFSKMLKVLDCPNCNKNTLIRCIGTGNGIIFKGEGFYETDYKQRKDAIKEGMKLKKEREGRRERGEP